MALGWLVASLKFLLAKAAPPAETRRLGALAETQRPGAPAVMLLVTEEV